MKQEGAEPLLVSAQVFAGIGAGAAQIADGFGFGLWNVDACKHFAAQLPGNLDGVLAIGLYLSPAARSIFEGATTMVS
ncbi:MAG: hypothetical protein R3F19_16135 [Verrucomicrobiales bacterium]